MAKGVLSCDSSKKKQSNLGYKGIGRLSGVPYCNKLIFMNIIDYAQKIVQTYTIDSEKYEEIKDDESYASLSFVELMDIIGQYSDILTDELMDLFCEIQKYDDLLKVNNSGFLVVLNDITVVLDNIINDDDFLQQLGFKYAVGFHTFKGDKNNSFSGIKIYIDNMLLCDEKELIQSLENYGLLEHTTNGQLQSVRGIAAMIYIADKVSISANARRTFIEVTDSNSIEFLKMLAEFVNRIYDTRYALSNYVSAKRKQQVGEEKLRELRNKALTNLRNLAKENIELTIEDGDEENDFNNMSVTEKKRYIKKKISTQLDNKIKEYIMQLDFLELSGAYEKFIKWLEKGQML